MNPESTGIPAKPTQVDPTVNPAPPAAAKPPSPPAGPRMGRAPGTERLHQPQPRRNYDPGQYARASREHGRGRHGR